MSRVTAILSRARKILADKDKTRWSDEDLIETLNEGLTSFLQLAETLEQRGYVLIEDNLTHYDMSPHSTRITRVDYLSEVLEVKTYEEMDKISTKWREHTGAVAEYVIFNKQKAGNFKIYPIIQGGYAGVVTANSLYGGLIDIIVTDDLLQPPEPADIEMDVSKYFLVYYIGKPRPVTIDTEDDGLDIDSMYDLALISYIAGTHLLYDQDSFSQTLGSSHLATFNGYIAEAKINESQSNNSFDSNITTYRSF